MSDSASSYSEKVLELFGNPRNAGSFDKRDPRVGTGLVGSPESGDVIKLQIRVNERGIITETCFKTYGCPAAIASSSLVTDWLKGRTLDEAGGITSAQIASELDLPPVKIHCSILTEDAIKAAIADFRAKHGAIRPSGEKASVS